MTNAPKSRKTHVVRIYGTNKNKDILHDIYVDVERIDQATYRQKVDGKRQKTVKKLNWRDDPSKPEEYLDLDETSPEDERLTRKYVIVKVCDPESTDDLNDPEEWVPVRRIRRIKSRKKSKRMNVRQDKQERIVSAINADITDSRVVEARRIVHYDTNIDDEAQRAADADPNLKQYVVGGRRYQRKDGTDGTEDTKDNDQYVEHEIVKKIVHKGNTVYYDDPNLIANNGRQVKKTKFLNQYLIDESEPAKSEKLGLNDMNPPYRLDPYQNIINVKFASLQSSVVGIRAAPEEDSYRTEISDNGTTWMSEFDASASNAASGLGRTVVASERVYVAFGKPKKGSACFIAIDGHDIRRGVLNDTGDDLIWSVIGTINFDENNGGEATSCSFAGDFFFISYVIGDSKHSHLAVSSDDGLSFTTGVDPWSGIVLAASVDGDRDPAPLGSCVAYDKNNEIYVTVGAFSRFYQGQFEDTGGGDPFQTNFSDSNFMSSISRNGISWTPRYDKSQGSGTNNLINGTSDIGSDQATERVGSRVAFGNDIFVAASSYKSQVVFPQPPVGFHTLLTATSCGVATSTDGKNWVNRRLPGALAATLNSGGDNYSVKFIKAKRPGSITKGFFVLGGGEFFSGESFTRTGRLWVSEDGINWTQVKSFSNEFPVIISAINKTRGKVVNI